MATTYRRPGVYLEESLLVNPVDVAGATTVACFVGMASKGPINTPVRIESWQDFTTLFGNFDNVDYSPDGDPDVSIPALSYLPFSVYSYFQSGGRVAYIIRSVSARQHGRQRHGSGGRSPGCSGRTRHALRHDPLPRHGRVGPRARVARPPSTTTWTRSTASPRRVSPTGRRVRTRRVPSSSTTTPPMVASTSPPGAPRVRLVTRPPTGRSCATSIPRPTCSIPRPTPASLRPRRPPLGTGHRTQDITAYVKAVQDHVIARRGRLPVPRIWWPRSTSTSRTCRSRSSRATSRMT